MEVVFRLNLPVKLGGVCGVESCFFNIFANFIDSEHRFRNTFIVRKK
jgi:hypothetical protein